jgi:hypothetical protein
VTRKERTSLERFDAYGCLHFGTARGLVLHSVNARFSLGIGAIREPRIFPARFPIVTTPQCLMSVMLGASLSIVMHRAGEELRITEDSKFIGDLGAR